jgi:DNA-binding NtrC family response regulator
MNSRILFISGRQEDARKLTQMLWQLPLSLHHVGNLEQARQRLAREAFDAVLTESELSDGLWVDALSLVRQQGDEPKLVVTSLHADSRLWCEVLNLGGYDLLAQPFFEPEVRRVLANACGCGERAHCAAIGAA